MKTMFVQYQTWPEAADANQVLIEAVLAELAETDPGTVSYSAFRLADNVSFMHVAVIAGPGNPLAELTSFAEFQRDLVSRCVAPPSFTEAATLGLYAPTLPASAISAA